jgi:hypothetical protein
LAQFKLLNQRGADGTPRAAILADDDRVIDLLDALPGTSWAASTLSVLGAWDIAEPALAALAGALCIRRRQGARVCVCVQQKMHPNNQLNRSLSNEEKNSSS